jgi:hypothetical protein
MYATTSCENSNPIYFDNDNPLIGFQFGSSICVSEYQTDTSTIGAGDVVTSFFLFVIIIMMVFRAVPTIIKGSIFK